MWTIPLPLFIQISKNKKFYLNLNGYRNAHFFELNKAKTEFKDLVEASLAGIPKQSRVRLRYDFYSPSMARRDLMNVISVVDKFVSDVLPEVGIIDDDHVGHIPEVHAHFGGLDRQNPRVDLTIIPLPVGGEEPITGDQSMSLKLTIDENAIKACVLAYLTARPAEVLSQLNMIAGRGGNGFSMNMAMTEEVINDAIVEACAAQLPGMALTVTLHATRGDTGYTATIEAGLELTADKILSGIGGSLLGSTSATLVTEPEPTASVEVTIPTKSVTAVATKPSFTRKPKPVVEEEVEEVVDLENATEIQTLSGASTFEDEDVGTGIGQGSNLEDDDEDFEMPAETPEGLTSNSDEPDSDVVDRSPAPNLFRKDKPTGFKAPADAGGERKRNALFGKTARPDNSHLNQDS